MIFAALYYRNNGNSPKHNNAKLDNKEEEVFEWCGVWCISKSKYTKIK